MSVLLLLLSVLYVQRFYLFIVNIYFIMFFNYSWAKMELLSEEVAVTLKKKDAIKSPLITVVDI